MDEFQLRPPPYSRSNIFRDGCLPRVAPDRGLDGTFRHEFASALMWGSDESGQAQFPFVYDIRNEILYKTTFLKRCPN